MNNVVEHFLKDFSHSYVLSHFAFLAATNNNDLSYIQFLVKEDE
jgi:hypothetical protein